MERYELPSEWRWTTVLEVVVSAQPGFASGKKEVAGGLAHLRMNNIGSDCELNLHTVAMVPPELARPRHFLQPGDVLVCHPNSAKLVGKTALFNVGGQHTFSNHLTRLRVDPSIVDARWLWRVLATLWRERYFENRCKKWVNQATIERDTLLAAPVPLPPLPEQQRIVARIEAVFEQSRAAREALDRIPPLVKRFRQSVLAAAFRGDLTERNPDDEPTSALLERICSQRGNAPDPSNLPELPERWVWTTIGDIGQVMGGLTKNSKRAALPLQMPYLRVANVYANALDLSDVQKIGVELAELERVLLQKGDLLVVEGNGSIEQIGRVAVWNGAVEPCLHQNHIIKVRFDIPAVSEYALYWLLSPGGRDRIMQVTSSTSGLYTLSLSKVASLMLPLAPLPEQHRIVARIQALCAEADAGEAAVKVARRRLAALDGAVLARAFRGEL